MKIFKVCLILMAALLVTNCFEDRDDNAILASEINDFVWKAMNATYLYKAQINELANDAFSSDEDYGNYLNQFSTPEAIFESLIYERETVDRFSFIIPNYIDFLQGQEGVSLSNGLDFEFYLEPGSEENVFLAVRMILNNSVASGLNIQRGQLIDAIDGIQLTQSNVFDLLGQESYTLNFATYNTNGTSEVTDDSIESTGESLFIAKQVYTENPVHLVDVFEVNGQNVGYLIYNGFNNEFENELNAAFAQFQASNIQHLILDLRYNPGGFISTAAVLGSMITGQFNGQVFSKLVYNEELSQNDTNIPFVNTLSNNTSLNSLNLNRVYVLTTDASGSASELVINSLDEYIDVVQIGANTAGKTQASRTLFDSTNLGPNDINPNHTYALQPLIANSINVNDEEVPPTGLVPDIQVFEAVNDYGVLGDTNERLLAAAIADIEGLGRFVQPNFEMAALKLKQDLKPQLYMDLDVPIDLTVFE